MSRKEKEVVVRLSERDLRALGYIGEFGEDVDGEMNEGEESKNEQNCDG